MSVSTKQGEKMKGYCILGEKVPQRSRLIPTTITSPCNFVKSRCQVVDCWIAPLLPILLDAAVTVAVLNVMLLYFFISFSI